MSEIIILAHGSFPHHQIPLGILNSGKPIICCDGAVKELDKRGISPYAIVGDMDSIGIELSEKYKTILYKFEEQETNDLTKSFKFSLNYVPERIIILGATGKREDHTIGNISLLLDYSRLTNAKVEMYTDYGLFMPHTGSGFFDFKEGTQISIFSLSPDTKIASEGLKYPLKGVEFDSWWKATLNEVEKTPFYIDSGSTGIILYAAF